MKSTRCQVPRQSSPSRTGTDSPAVPEVHVLRADVLGALVPVVVGVVGLARDKPAEELGKVLDEPGLELVDANAARRVRRVDARDPLGDAALLDRLVDLVRDVPDGQPTCGSELGLALVDLHGFHFDGSGGPRPNGNRLGGFSRESTALGAPSPTGRLSRRGWAWRQRTVTRRSRWSEPIAPT